ncbi:hypothetical protein ATO8_03221 [Roseivivax marinus]|uniref:Aspartate carbamoyltransferase catalytic subunit n=1 Tax=Roseivivax marinus TaxID=1379903 RepID=W4HNA4_9RHOB|nr:hypothetical protein [Roseivivax marinus]ETW13868.1 hypothetical protein ATO8_03221 [Roseivivax marinus]
MSDLDIRAAETGTTRVFDLDLPPEAVERFTTQAGTGEWPLQYALGADRLRQSFVEIIKIRDLGTMPLSAYLAEAHNVSGSDFEAARPRLDALRGHVVVLPAQAFDRTAQTLNPQAPLRHVGTFREAGASAQAAPLRSASARGSAADADPVAATPAKTSPLLRALAIVVLALIAGVALYLLATA